VLDLGLLAAIATALLAGTLMLTASLTVSMGLQVHVLTSATASARHQRGMTGYLRLHDYPAPYVQLVPLNRPPSAYCNAMPRRIAACSSYVA